VTVADWVAEGVNAEVAVPLKESVVEAVDVGLVVKVVVIEGLTV
jgi:hypothetical protein